VKNIKRFENHGDPRLPTGLYVHESDYDDLARQLAEEQEFSRQQIRLVAAHASNGERLEAQLAKAQEALKDLRGILELREDEEHLLGIIDKAEATE
jgi:hypothetical protein